MSQAADRHFEALVIGAGFSGLYGYTGFELAQLD